MDPQVPILRSFLAEVACKEAVQEEAENSFNGEFARLKRQSTKIRTDKIFPTKTAEKQENVKKNRYKDIVPFDHSRVRITLNISNGDSDYINASFIKGVSGQNAYIATQGPLPHTVLDLWRMLWQYDVQVVVMACREFEMGRKKCERYWPATTEDVFVCEPFIVNCVSEENKGDYISRVLNVTYQSASRTIRQLHYMNWPDHGVPDSIPPILELLQEMRAYQEHEDIPICIHCSAGCGRTGALCAIDYTWNMLKRQCIPESFSVFDLVQDMRTQRPSVVQTKEQYALVYRAIRFLFENHVEALESSCSAEQQEVNSSPLAITPDFSSDLSDLSEPEDELHIETEPRHVQPAEQTNHMLSMDIPMLKSPPMPVEPEDMVTSTRRPEDILRDMAVKPPWNLPPHTHTHDTPMTQSVIQTPQTHTPSTSHTHHTHHVQTSVTGDNTHHVSPYQDLTHSAEQVVQVTHTLPVLQIPLIQHLTHTPQKALIEHTPQMPHTHPTTPHVAGVSPHPPDLCVTVEDPYFSPVTSPTTMAGSSGNGHCLKPPQLTLNDQPLQEVSQTHTAAVAPAGSDDEDVPPRLPERTPESFILASDTQVQFPSAPKHTQNGDPPSPVPPIPERTPESFELASADELEKLMRQLKHTDSVGKVGVSSEWSGKTHTSPTVKRSWSRSKSVKVRMSLPAPPPVPLSVAPAPTESASVASPTYKTQAPRSLTPPLPERTPESFIVPTDAEVSRITKPSLAVQPSNSSGGPPSPVPPLPERTPESFELPLADAAFSVPSLLSTTLPENKRRSMLCLRDNVVLRSGDSQRSPRCTSAIFLPTSNKSVSLPRNSALFPSGSPQLTLSVAAAAPCCEPGEVELRQASAQHSGSSIGSSSSGRSNSSTTTPQVQDKKQLAALSVSPLRTTEALSPLQRVGSSREWAGPSQPRAQDPFKNRSKSVKVKSSNTAGLSVFAPDVAISPQAEGTPAVGASAAGPTSLPEAGAEGNSVTETDSGKGMTRKKSWRKFMLKNKQKSAPPPARLPPPYSAIAGLRLVFGNRLGKPKGPRTRPETWV